MSNKNIDEVIKELCQLSSVTITKAGNGESLSPAELVALTNILDSWKDTIIKENKKYNENLSLAIEQMELLKSKCSLSFGETADYNELLINLK